MVKPNRNVVDVIAKEHVPNLPCTLLTGTNHNLRCMKTPTNKSIYTCQCDPLLIEIFSELARFATTKSKSYVKTLSCDDPITSLPPLICSNKKTVVLDLDKTLIHSTRESGRIRPRNYDFKVKPLFNGQPVKYYVLKRPFVDEFLRFLSESNFEIVVFTAGVEDYASPLLDILDPDGLISHRLYRNSCKKLDGRSVKDLSNLGRDLKNVVIVDDRPKSYRLQPDNAMPIRPFTDDLGDVELKILMTDFFAKCHEFEDMRDAVKHYFGYRAEDLKCFEKWIEDDIFEA